MGEMGRAFDGGYQQYALLPVTHVIRSPRSSWRSLRGRVRGRPGRGAGWATRPERVEPVEDFALPEERTVLLGQQIRF
jgi:hypothetical protein